MASISTRPELVVRAPAGASALRRFWSWAKENAFAAGITFVLLWVVGIPLVAVIVFSFREGSPVAPGAFTLANYRQVYASPQTFSALTNSLIYAAVVSVAGLFLATVFAWLLERTDMPGRNWAWVMMLLPLAMPGMLASMAWILLLANEIGLFNMALRKVVGLFGVVLESGPINIYSMTGMVFVESIRGSTTLFLMMVAAFRLLDPSLEEAASMSGASTSYTVRRITAGLMVPALLAAAMFAFIGNLDDLETPLLIGLPAGIFFLPTIIYFTASQGGAWGLSAAYTTVFLLITIAMVVIYFRVVLRKTGQFASITGKAYRPRRMSLGRWRWPAFGVFVVYFVITVGAPVFVLLWASLLPVYEVPSWEAIGRLTLDNYVQIPTAPRIARSLLNTVVLAAGTATATMLLAFLVGWLVVRQRVRGGIGLDAMAFVPHAIPTVAVAVALIAFYLHPWVRWIPIYGTLTLMVLALMTRYIAFASRTANAAMTQIGKELEEVAYISGIGKVRTLFSITMRLLLPAFIAGWVWVAANAGKNLSVPLMLATPQNETIATTLFFYWTRKADFSLASALGMVILGALGILTVLARRIITSGYSGDG